MLKSNKIYMLWLFIAIVAFLSCNNTDDAVAVSTKISEEDETVISDPDFITVNFYDDKYRLSMEAIKEDVVSDTINTIRIVGIEFLKDNSFRVWTVPTAPNRPPSPLEKWTTINECAVGDTVGLRCGVVFPREIIHNLKIIAKITSSKTGDVQYITLLEQNLGYVAILPNKSAYAGCLHISDVDVEGEVLKVSSDGDILIAEIYYGDQKITKTLPIKSIENK